MKNKFPKLLSLSVKQKDRLQLIAFLLLLIIPALLYFCAQSQLLAMQAVLLTLMALVMVLVILIT